MNRVKGKWQKLRRQVNKSKASEGDSPGVEDDTLDTHAPATPAVSAPSRWQKLIEQLQEEERLRSLATRDVSVTVATTSSSSPAGDTRIADTTATTATTATVRHVPTSHNSTNTPPSGGEAPEFPKMSQVKGRWLKLRKQITADMARERDTESAAEAARQTPAPHAREPAGTATESTHVVRAKHTDSEQTAGSNIDQPSSNTKENTVPNEKLVGRGKPVTNGNIVPNGNVVQAENLAEIRCSVEPRKMTSVKGRWLKLKTRVTTANMAVHQLQQVRAQAVQRDGACAYGNVTEAPVGRVCDDISASQQIVSDRTFRATKKTFRARKPKQVIWSHNHPTLAVIPHRGHAPRVPLIARRCLAKSSSRHFARSSSVSSGYSSSHQMSPDSDVMDDDMFRLDAAERTETNTKWRTMFESNTASRQACT